ncbi:hypothetical protein [Nonomuraea sp. NPDC003214]
MKELLPEPCTSTNVGDDEEEWLDRMKNSPFAERHDEDACAGRSATGGRRPLQLQRERMNFWIMAATLPFGDLVL